MSKTPEDVKREILEEFVEKGADLEHARWAKWQHYLHTFLTWNNDIQAWVLPHEKKDHWESQINTPYFLLSEKEKESDRKEARTYLPLLNKYLDRMAEAAVAQERDRIWHEHLGLGKPIRDVLSHNKK